MSDDGQVTVLERQHEMAMAALGVAEDLGWLAAFLLGLLVQVAFHHWWLSVPATPLSYLAITYWYRKDESRKEDAWMKATGSGKYWKPQDD